MVKEVTDIRYRVYTGPADKYDILGAIQFNLLTCLGLCEKHLLLDIGCGSLSAGRLFIIYLNPGNYYGIEPIKWLIEEAIVKEIGNDLIKIKKPNFLYDNNFQFSSFNKKFDYLLAHSIFTHASKRQINCCIKEATKVMKKSSIFVASYIEGKNDYEGQNWKHAGFATYSQDYIIDILQKNKIYYTILDWKHPLDQKWILGFKEKEKMREIISTICAPKFTCLKNYSIIFSSCP